MTPNIFNDVGAQIIEDINAPLVNSLSGWCLCGIIGNTSVEHPVLPMATHSIFRGLSISTSTGWASPVQPPGMCSNNIHNRFHHMASIVIQ